MKTCDEKSLQIDTAEDLSSRRPCQYKKILEHLLKLKCRLDFIAHVEIILSSDRFSVYTSYRLGIEMLKPERPVWTVSSYRV